MTRHSLEQVVAQWLETVPHEDWCPSLIALHTYGSGACICDREQRIAAQVAAAIEATASRINGPPGEPELAYERKLAAALRALTQQEKP